MLVSKRINRVFFAVVLAFAFVVVPCFSLAISIIELEPDYDYDIDEGSYSVAGGSGYSLYYTFKYNHSLPGIDYSLSGECPHCFYTGIQSIGDYTMYQKECMRCGLVWFYKGNNYGVRSDSPQRRIGKFAHGDKDKHEESQWLRFAGKAYEAEYDRYRYFFYCPYEGCGYEYNFVGGSNEYIHPNCFLPDVEPEPTDAPVPTDEPVPTDAPVPTDDYFPTMPPLTPFPEDDYSFGDIGDDFSETSSSFGDILASFGSAFAGRINTFRSACNDIVNYFTSSEFGNGLFVTIFFFSLVVLIIYNWFIRSS